MSLAELEDQAAVKEVIDRFSNLEIDVPAQAKLFTPDLHITIYNGGQKMMEINGRQEMEEKFGAAMANASSSYHMNGQQVVELKSATEAVDTHYCQATIMNKEVDHQILNVSYIRYVDTLVKQDDQWLISDREQHIVFTEQRKLN